MAEESKKTGEASVSEESKKTAPKDTKPKEKRPGFFKECKSERKKIVWASLPSTVQNTVITVVVIIVATAIFAGFDALFRTAVMDWLVSLYKHFADVVV